MNFNGNICISIEISLKFVPTGPINNTPSLVQIMAWRQLGDKPLSEPMMYCLLTHICVTRPQWVKPCTCFSGKLKVERKYVHRYVQGFVFLWPSVDSRRLFNEFSWIVHPALTQVHIHDHEWGFRYAWSWYPVFYGLILNKWDANV